MKIEIYNNNSEKKLYVCVCECGMWIGGWAVRETKMHCVKFCPASSTER